MAIMSHTFTRTPAFVCIDLETTGLDFDKCCILEVGIVVADEKALPMWGDAWLIEPTTDLSEMNDFVRGMHTSNGLLSTLETRENEDGNPVQFYSPEDAQSEILG